MRVYMSLVLCLRCGVRRCSSRAPPHPPLPLFDIFLTFLTHSLPQITWLSLRPHPVVYIRGRPYEVATRPSQGRGTPLDGLGSSSSSPLGPLSGLSRPVHSHGHATPGMLEQQEATLRDEVMREAKARGGTLLVHDLQHHRGGSHGPEGGADAGAGGGPAAAAAAHDGGAYWMAVEQGDVLTTAEEVVRALGQASDEQGQGEGKGQGRGGGKADRSPVRVRGRSPARSHGASGSKASGPLRRVPIRDEHAPLEEDLDTLVGFFATCSVEHAKEKDKDRDKKAQLLVGVGATVLVGGSAARTELGLVVGTMVDKFVRGESRAQPSRAAYQFLCVCDMNWLSMARYHIAWHLIQTLSPYLPLSTFPSDPGSWHTQPAVKSAVAAMEAGKTHVSTSQHRGVGRVVDQFVGRLGCGAVSQAVLEASFESVDKETSNGLSMISCALSNASLRLSRAEDAIPGSVSSSRSGSSSALEPSTPLSGLSGVSGVSGVSGRASSATPINGRRGSGSGSTSGSGDNLKGLDKMKPIERRRRLSQVRRDYGGTNVGNGKMVRYDFTLYCCARQT